MSDDVNPVGPSPGPLGRRAAAARFEAIGRALRPLVDRLAEPPVLAITVVGSQLTQFAGAQSDIDLFVYLTDGVSEDDAFGLRRAVAADVADPEAVVVIGQPGHPYADRVRLSGMSVWLDVMYWTKSWAETELDWRLTKQEPQMGYSTAFWRSIRNGYPLSERGDWHVRLQERARVPYPDLLRDRIIKLNRDLIGLDNPFSFLNQALRAVREADWVAVNHRLTKWVESYFDVIFALNRILTPGEKRLVGFAQAECQILPEGFPEDLAAFIRAGSLEPDQVEAVASRLLARLDVAAARCQAE